MKAARLLSCTLMLLAFAGCAQNMNEIMKSWEGHHVSELVENWGPPAQIMDGGNGVKIYSYQSTVSYTTPGSSSTMGNVYTYDHGSTYYGSTTHSPSQTQTYQRYRMFWVNTKGYIYRWKWQGR